MLSADEDQLALEEMRVQHQLEMEDMLARRLWSNRLSDARVDRINALRRFIKAKGPKEEAAAEAEQEATEEAHRKVEAQRPEPRSAFFRSLESAPPS